MIWIASPEISLSMPKKVSISDLIQHPILTHARGTQPYEEVAAHLSGRRDVTVRLVPSSNLAACIQMTIDGFGIAAVPAAMVAHELRSGELLKVNYSWTPGSLCFFARFDTHRSAHHVVKAANIGCEVSHGFILEDSIKMTVTSK